MAQLKEFQASLAKMASGSMTLQSSLEATRLAVQAAVSSAFQTPEVSRRFASTPPYQAGCSPPHASPRLPTAAPLSTPTI